MKNNKDWGGHDWVNQGGNILARNPHIAKRFISNGLKFIPEEAIAWFNLGIALHQAGKIEAAIRSYRHSLKLKGCPIKEVKNNLSQDLLLNGEFKAGWELYESRLKLPKYNNSYFEDKLGGIWRGFNDKRACKKLILVAEQGLGDTMQFIRFAIQLQRKGISITLFCQSTLISLLEESSEIKFITDRIDDKEILKETRWCPLMSLPHILSSDRSIKTNIGSYLRADKNRLHKWKKILKRKNNHLLVGLHWQGNLKHEGSLYSKGRSTKFDDWLPLQDVEGVEYIAIQKGEGLEEIKEYKEFPFVEGQELFMYSMDFRDTASVLSLCDLIISADSGIIHLAGALGIPTWVALKYIPEWRWLLNKNKTHWYKSLKLYRQVFDGNWETVIKEIKRDLNSLSLK